MQALDFRKPVLSSPIIEKMRTSYRNEIAFINDDVMMYPEIKKSVAFIKHHDFKIPSTF
jgi:histidine ammonia-lyase